MPAHAHGFLTKPESLQAHARSDAWLAEIAGFKAWPAHEAPNLKMLAWLPNEMIAKKWMQYVKDTAVADTTPPPSPTNASRRQSFCLEL